MADYPYLIVVNFALGANGAGSPSFSSPSGESYDLKEIVFVSTGAFNLTAIRDSEGRFYSNATVSNPIPSTMLQNSANANLSIRNLINALLLKPTMQILFDLLDTSAAPNTVRILINSIRHSEA